MIRKSLIKDNISTELIISELETLFDNMGLPLKFSVKSMSPLDIESMGYDPNETYNTKGVKRDMNLSDEFDSTFNTDRIVSTVAAFIKNKSLTIDSFKSIICDDAYSDNEFMFWCKDNISVCNNLNNEGFIQYDEFTMLLKTIHFGSYMLMQRFVAYLINECFIMFSFDGKSCYYRRQPTRDHPEPISKYALSNFENINVNFYKDDKLGSTNLKMLIRSIPMHSFSDIVYKWNHSIEDKHSISLAHPFNFQKLDHRVSENELPQELVYYFKSVLCADSIESWNWFRSYLANILLNPDKKTRVMLVLYSKDKQVGKSTLLDLLSMIVNTSNICLSTNLKHVFGDRGCPQAVGRKIIWLEEMVKTPAEFFSIQENMKSSITDTMTTCKALYKESMQYNNTHEYIAASNNLIAVLEDRMTILQVASIMKDNKDFYSKLRSSITPEVINKFVTYLSDYQSSMPMSPLMTAIQETMYENSKDPFECFTEALMESYNDELERFEHKKGYIYSVQSDTYKYYKSFNAENNYKSISMKAFNTKLLSSDERIGLKQIIDKSINKRIRVYTWGAAYLTNATSDILSDDESDHVN
jgi:hypothetical protein